MEITESSDFFFFQANQCKGSLRFLAKGKLLCMDKKIGRILENSIAH